MSKNFASGGIVAGAVGGAAFLLFYVALSVPFAVAAAVGVAAYGAGFFLTPRPKTKTQEVDSTLEEGRKKITQIRTYGRTFASEQAEAVEAIAVMADRILHEAEDDIRSLKKARPFLTYYLDSTLKILELYAGLKAQALSDQEIVRTTKRVEEMLGSMRGAFEQLLARLLADDVMDLDTEMRLLEQTLKMEGLGK